jgi:hypothetical protein
VSAILRLALPLTLWIASFSGVYALHGLLCSGRFAGMVEEGTARLLLVLAALAALAMQALLLTALRAPRWREPDPALRRIGLGLAVVALVSTAWSLLPPVLAAGECNENPGAKLDAPAPELGN